MIDQLRMIAIFQTVAELGSFREAANSLNLSPSVISHHVSQLEDQIGLPLLYRSTRRISLTDAGAELLAASQKMSRAAQEGLAAMNRRVNQPVGKLSITVNTASMHRPYIELYSRFARAYPEVELHMHVTDHMVSLEGSKFDVAIRGHSNDLEDSSYIARKLGKIEFCLFAAPSYVNARAPLRSFDDLADWDLIKNPQIPWNYLIKTAEDAPAVREPRIAMSCDNYTAARHFVDEGLGFMAETYPLVAKDFRSGKLIQLLPKKTLRSIDIYAIYPANSPRDSLVRLFVDFMMDQDWMTEYGFQKN